MKKYRFWIAIVLPIIATLVLTVGAFAAYAFWTAQANVTVVEGMTVVMQDKSGGTWDGSTWTITGLMPGENRTITFRVTNTATSGFITIAGTVDYPVYAGITNIWTIPDPIVTAGDFEDCVLTIAAAGDATPGGPYTFTIGFTRE